MLICIQASAFNSGFGRLKWPHLFVVVTGYLLTRLEGTTGSPERPLSDLGLVSYRSYWRDVILDHMIQLKEGNSLSVKGVWWCHCWSCDVTWSLELSKQSGVSTDDLVSTMQRLGIIKYCKGQHIVLHDKVCGLHYGSVWLTFWCRNCSMTMWGDVKNWRQDQSTLLVCHNNSRMIY